jgi:hypothetical protein
VLIYADTWQIVMPYPPTEADDRPKGTAKGATATHTSTQQPSDIHRKGFAQFSVHPRDGGLVFLGGNSRHKPRWEFCFKSVAEAKAEILCMN